MAEIDDTLQKALEEALAHGRGRRARPRWDVFGPASIKALRRRLDMSQTQFASAYGLSLDCLKSWEAGRSVPEQPSCLVLGLIAHDPGRALDFFREVETLQALDRSRENGAARSYGT